MEVQEAVFDRLAATCGHWHADVSASFNHCSAEHCGPIPVQAMRSGSDRYPPAPGYVRRPAQGERGDLAALLIDLQPMEVVAKDGINGIGHRQTLSAMRIGASDVALRPGSARTAARIKDFQFGSGLGPTGTCPLRAAG